MSRMLMLVFMLVTCLINLSQSHCHTDQPHQNLLCNADWVIKFDMRSKEKGDQVWKYKGKLLQVYKPIVPEWIMNNLLKVQKNTFIYTQDPNRIDSYGMMMKKGIHIIAGKNEQLNETNTLYLSMLSGLAVKLDMTSSTHYSNLEFSYLNNCDCHIDWVFWNPCADPDDPESMESIRTLYKTVDSCVGPAEMRFCFNRISYCTRIDGECQWYYRVEESPVTKADQCEPVFCSSGTVFPGCEVGWPDPIGCSNPPPPSDPPPPPPPPIPGCS